MGTAVAEPAVDLPRGVTVPAATARRSRLTLLFGVIALTSVAAFVIALVSAVWPLGSGEQPTYRDLADQRTYAWAFFAVAGVQLVVGVCAAGLAGLLLTPRRGSALGTVGAALLFVGAAAYGVGIGGWASAYWFASDTTTLGRRSASALVQQVNDDATHTLLVPVAGAVIVGIGSLILVAGIWRARTVPRAILVATALSTVATVVLPPNGIAGLVAEAVSSATTIAIGWYALVLWSSPSVDAGPVHRPSRPSRDQFRGSNR
jgi:hypothetical protein